MTIAPPTPTGDPWADSSVAAPAAEPKTERPAPEPEQTDVVRTAGGRVDRVVDSIDSLRTPLSPRATLASSVVIALATVAIYWFVQRYLTRWTSSNPNLNFYVVQPLLWTGLAAASFFGWRHLRGRPMARPTLVGVAALVGAFHVAILVFGGFVFGFGDSPTAGRLINYPKNLLYLVTMLAGLEAARAFLFTVWSRRHRVLASVVVTGFFAVMALSYPQLRLILDGQWDLDLIAGRAIPALALSALLTWLVAVGGIGPSFGYVVAIYALEWFSPVYPANPWWMLLLVGVLLPLAAVPLIRSLYDATAERAALGPLSIRTTARVYENGPGVARPVPMSEDDDYGDEETEAAPVAVATRIGWAALWIGLLVVIVVVFGVMGVRPYLVNGISMEPAYERGDIALVREVDPATLEVGDVIKFRLGSMSAIHRIISIEQTPDGEMITTQGDNVDRPDPPIRPEQVEGQVVFLLPEIGKLAFWLD